MNKLYNNWQIIGLQLVTILVIYCVMKFTSLVVLKPRWPSDLIHDCQAETRRFKLRLAALGHWKLMHKIRLENYHEL